MQHCLVFLCVVTLSLLSDECQGQMQRKELRKQLQRQNRKAFAWVKMSTFGLLFSDIWHVIPMFLDQGSNWDKHSEAYFAHEAETCGGAGRRARLLRL